MRPKVPGSLTLTVALSLLLASLALALAGCGGGGGDASGGEETTDSTPTATIEDTDGSYSGSNAICKTVTNSSSALNIAASTGDFATVSAEWSKLAASAPAALKSDVETVAEGYGKIATDPAGFGVLDTEPYKSSLAAVNAWTATNCAQ